MKLLPPHSRQRKRMLIVLALLGLTALAVGLILWAFRQNLMYFYTPSDIVQRPDQIRGVFELGGMVVPGSLRNLDDDLLVEFVVSDGAHRLPVHYRGVLPDLFGEGQGVVVYGRMIDDVVRANRVLAKHDENYMPAHLQRRLDQIHPSTDSSDPGATAIQR